MSTTPYIKPITQNNTIFSMDEFTWYALQSKEADDRFEIYNISLSDIEFLKMAKKLFIQNKMLGEQTHFNSTNKNIIDIGKMMEIDYNIAKSEIEEMEIVFDFVGYRTLSHDVKENILRLKKSSFEVFDKLVCDIILQTIQDTYSFFEDSINYLKDENLKIWSFAKLGLLKHHQLHTSFIKQKLYL